VPVIHIAPVVVTQVIVQTGLNINALSFAPVSQATALKAANWSFVLQ